MSYRFLLEKAYWQFRFIDHLNNAYTDIINLDLLCMLVTIGDMTNLKTETWKKLEK